MESSPAAACRGRLPAIWAASLLSCTAHGVGLAPDLAANRDS